MNKTIWFVACAVSLAACGDAGVETRDSQAQGLRPSCDLSGDWAVEVEVPVQWPATRSIAAGEGHVLLQARSVRKQAATTAIDRLSLCGVHLPTAQTRQGDALRWQLAGDLLAHNTMPAAPSLVQFTKVEKGGHFRLQPTALMLGAVIRNPALSPWPEDIDTYAVDADDDGAPGVTLQAVRDHAFVAPPVDRHRKHHAARMHVALRAVLQSASGILDSCDAMAGLGVVPVLDGAMAMNVAVLGCEREDGRLCDAAQRDYLQTYQPIYEKRGNAPVHMRRLAAVDAGFCGISEL